MSEPIIVQKAPMPVNVQVGQNYHWCSCGQTKNQPFCDSSHDSRARHGRGGEEEKREGEVSLDASKEQPVWVHWSSSQSEESELSAAVRRAKQQRRR